MNPIDIELIFDEQTNSYRMKTPQTAQMEAVSSMNLGGALEKITRSEILDMPVGKVVVGAAGGILLDRLLGDRLAKWGAWGNVALALVAAKFGPKFLGKETSDALAFVLLYEAVLDPVDKALNKILPEVESAVSGESSTDKEKVAAVAEAKAILRSRSGDLGVYEGAL